MMFDQATILSDGQDFGGQGVGSVLSSKSYNAGAFGVIPHTQEAVSGDPGNGATTPLMVRVVQAFVSQNSTATLKVEFVTADNEALSSNLKVRLATDAVLVTDLVLGYNFRFRGVPRGFTQQFCGFRYTVGVEALMVGKLLGCLAVEAATAWGG